MSRLDEIAFEAAKRLLSGGTENATVAENCPAPLDLVAVVKEAMLRSSHYRAQCPMAPWNERGRTAAHSNFPLVPAGEQKIGL